MGRGEPFPRPDFDTKGHASMRRMPAINTTTAFLTIVMLICATIAGCSSGHASSSPSPTRTPSPSSFPAFHDWRAAYYAPDGHLHAVTLDGKTDLTGPAFPEFSFFYGNNGHDLIWTAGASPDGHFIAYLNPALVVFDVRAQTPASSRLHQGGYYDSHLFWSPNSQLIAIGDTGENNVPGFPTYIVSPSPLTIPFSAPIPGTTGTQKIIPEGWLDNHTLLVYVQVAQGNTVYSGLIQSMDITTGATQTITTFPHAELSNLQFTISPDGQEVFLSNYPAHDEPFTPLAEVLDVSTGTVHPLPHLAALEAQSGTWISGAAWKPGTHTLAVTIGYVAPDENNAADWLVNTDTDTETSFPSGDYVQSWSPDGATLVLSNAYVNENGTGEGPYTLTAVTFSASGQATLTTLTRQSLDFTFLGFIRSA
jgi:hypothetical protein